MITRDDVILAFSWSGETVELGNLVSYSRKFAVPLIAITSNAESTLAKAAEVVLAIPQSKEACPHGLAPTTSTMMQLALGDCLAIALLESKGFTARDFKVLHPGGQLGARLKFVGDLMHKGDRLPLTPGDMPMAEAIVVMTEKAFGCLGVVDENGRLAGIITDGDLRRHMGDGLLSRRTGEIMTGAPKTVSPDLLASAALEVINSSSITALFVVEDGRPGGHHPHPRPAACRRRLAPFPCHGRARPDHPRFLPKQKDVDAPGARPGIARSLLGFAALQGRGRASRHTKLRSSRHWRRHSRCCRGPRCRRPRAQSHARRKGRLCLRHLRLPPS